MGSSDPRRAYASPHMQDMGAFAAMTGFLRLNGYSLEAGEAEATVFLQELAAGERTEADLSAWIREHLAELPTPARRSSGILLTSPRAPYGSEPSS